MAAHPSKVRNACEELIRLAMDAPGEFDRAAAVKRSVELGASRARAHAWIDAILAERAPPEAARAPSAAEQAALERGRLMDGLPTPAALAALEAAALAPESATDSAVPDSSLTSVGPPHADESKPGPSVESEPGEPPISVLPPGGRGTLAHLDTLIETVRRVLHHATGEVEGKLRNPRMVLLSGDMLRRSLETALKIYERADTIELVERFMAEVHAELRLFSPDAARAVVARLRIIQDRWAAA